MDINSEIRILKLLIKSNFKDRKDLSIRDYIKRKIRELKKILNK